MAEQGDLCFVFFDSKFKNCMVGEFVSQNTKQIVLYVKNKEKIIDYGLIRGGIYTHPNDGTEPSITHAAEILKTSLHCKPEETIISVDIETGRVIQVDL